jgi:uncharacterized protein (TIGR02246 family)
MKAAMLALAMILPCTCAQAAEVTEADLLHAATDLGHRYDANYAAKNPAAMAALYAEDGVLVSPAGAIIRGRDALKVYYAKRFASGAYGHAIKVLEVHVQGDGGYGVAEFSVNAPHGKGQFRREQGHIVAIYARDADGWHLRLVEPSIPESAGK